MNKTDKKMPNILMFEHDLILFQASKEIILK